MDGLEAAMLLQRVAAGGAKRLEARLQLPGVVAEVPVQLAQQALTGSGHRRPVDQLQRFQAAHFAVQPGDLNGVPDALLAQQGDGCLLYTSRCV